MKGITCGMTLILLSLLTSISFAGDPSKAGDVLGRALTGDKNISVGHVGVWTGEDAKAGKDVKLQKVLEVFDSGISDRYDLKRFKDAATVSGKSYYYGAKYNGSGSTNQFAIVKSGYDQKKWSSTNGFIYLNPTFCNLYFPKYREGQYGTSYIWNKAKKRYEKKNIAVESIFRCDTFVNYMYKKGSGKHILYMAAMNVDSPKDSKNNYNTAPGYVGLYPTSPTYLYNSMSKSRI